MSTDDQACKTPIQELLRAIPKDQRLEWEIQWSESGACIGHSICPVGHLAHEAADEIDVLNRSVDALNRQIEQIRRGDHG